MGLVPKLKPSISLLPLLNPSSLLSRSRPRQGLAQSEALKITALKDAITRYELLSPEIREDVEARVGGLEIDNDIDGEAVGEESDEDV